MKPSLFTRSQQAASALFGGQKVLLRLTQTYGRWLVLTVLIAIVVVLVSPFFYLEEVEVHEGETLYRAIESQIPFQFEDPDLLDAWQRRRDEKYLRIYTYDSERLEQALENLQSLFDVLRVVVVPTDEDLESTRTLRRLAQRLEDVRAPDGTSRGYVFGENTLQTLWRHRNNDKFFHDLEEILRDVYNRGVVLNAAQFRSHAGRLRLERLQRAPVEEILPSKVLDYPKDVLDFLTFHLRQYFEGLPERPGDSPRTAAREVVAHLIRPNIEYDEEKSRIQMERFTEGRKAVTRLIPPGTPLLPSGTVVGEKERRIVEKYNEALSKYVTLRLLGNIAFVVLVVSIIGFYVLKFRRNFRFDIHTTLLTGLPLILVLGAQRLLMIVTGAQADDDFAGYLFFSGTIGMLGVLLLDVRLALILVTWGCMLFGLQVNLDFQYMAVALLGGYTAVAALYTLRERREVVLAGVRIAFVNVLGILILAFIRDPTAIPWKMAAVGIFNGIACSLLTIAVLPWFELLFGVVSDMRLLELTGLHHPLTQRLEKDAPGTWQHTLNVTKLAEAAAQAVGVNYLLVRAGAYFHDVGKMRKSTYFTENQASAEDKRRHQELRPQMSVLIIRDHVKSGIEIARKAKLPQKVIDFIPQHHGTSLIKFFYYKAIRQFDAGETKAPVREEDYRYPGPKPQSRETAIVMLADAVEATATAKLNQPVIREDDVRLVVHETVLEKFNDGQFDECDLTLNDLQVIRETFFTQLLSRFHTRIDYPKAPERRDASVASALPPTAPAKDAKENAKEAKDEEDNGESKKNAKTTKAQEKGGEG